MLFNLFENTMPSKSKKSKEDREDSEYKKEKKHKANKPSSSKKIKKEKHSKNGESEKHSKKDSKKKGMKIKKKDKPYTPEQFAKFKMIMREIDSKKCTVEDLKEILRKNDQKITGSRMELMERVADGELLGKIPRCPKCSGGRLRFDPEIGLYKCPGYYDERNFIHCHATFDIDSLEREPWVQ